MISAFLIRHGETDWNREGRFQGSRDIPLNDEGRAQARRLAEAWKAPLDAVLTSPLARARETAEILAASRNLPLAGVDRRLVERHYGLAEGLTLVDRRKQFPDGTIPGVEEPVSIRARARHFLETLVEEYSGRRVAVVSHGGFINVVLALVSGGEVGTGKTMLGNTSVSTLVYKAGRWTVTAVAQTFGTAALGLRE